MAASRGRPGLLGLSPVFDDPILMLVRLILPAVLSLAVTSLAAAPPIYKYTDARGVVTYTDKAVRGASIVVFRDRMVEHLEQQVRLDVARQNRGVTFTARNELYAPVEVELRLSGVHNAAPGSAQSIRKLVPPRSSVRLLALDAQIPGQPVRYTQVFKYALGNPTALAQAYRYPLPWVGGPFRLSQGPNGDFSHTGVKSRYARDIAMPVGTPIIAARAGTVVKIENAQSGRGSDPSGNFVRILHDDGTMGVYLHLMEGSVAVHEGQRVSVGTALARSGNTGNSTGPHLHFVVQRNTGLGLESIPYEFSQPVRTMPNFALGAGR
jgi:murein DD-endopeptidase MepM/ murein hydrolase activator NlpD